MSCRCGREKNPAVRNGPKERVCRARAICDPVRAVTGVALLARHSVSTDVDARRPRPCSRTTAICLLLKSSDLIYTCGIPNLSINVTSE